MQLDFRVWGPRSKAWLDGHFQAKFLAVSFSDRGFEGWQVRVRKITVSFYRSWPWKPLPRYLYCYHNFLGLAWTFDFWRIRVAYYQ